MGSMIKKFRAAINSKMAISSAIETNGIYVGSTPFSGYANLISQIPLNLQNLGIQFYKCVNVYNDEITNEQLWAGKKLIWSNNRIAEDFEKQFECKSEIYTIVDESAIGSSRIWKTSIDDQNYKELKFSPGFEKWKIDIFRYGEFQISQTSYVSDPNASLSEICTGMWIDEDGNGEQMILTPIPTEVNKGPGYIFDESITSGLIISGYVPEIDEIFSKNTSLKISLNFE